MSWLARPVYSNVPWLTVSPRRDQHPWPQQQDAVLTFDATTLSSGVYHAMLAIEHNDPAQGFPAEVPITFTVHTPTAVTLNGISTTKVGRAANRALAAAGGRPGRRRCSAGPRRLAAQESPTDVDGRSSSNNRPCARHFLTEVPGAAVVARKPRAS